MKEILFYFLQVIIISGLLYSYYHFFLRNNKFHRYNRFYLLGATIVSLILPFLDLNFYFKSEEDIPAIYQVLSVVRVGDNINQTLSPAIAWNLLLNIIYLLITVFFLFRFCFSLFELKRVLDKYPSKKMDNVLFVNTSENGTPFSFFNWLFWNENIPLNTSNGQKILKHELFHIQQKHSWDIIYLELLTIFCWINPFFHIIKKEVKVIHEFLADDFASNQQREEEYAELLLMQVLQTNQKLVNPFFHNQIKRRIIMITKSTQPGYTFIRKMMVLPMLAIVISMIAINCTSKDAIENEEATKIDIPTHTNSSGQDNKLKIEQASDEPSFRGGQIQWRKYLEKQLNANVPVDNGAPEGMYKVEIQFIVNENGFISDIKPLTNHGYGMEDEVIDLIKKGPKWIPAEQNGKKIKAFKTQPVTFVVSKEF